MGKVFITKANGDQEPFEPAKLVHSLERAGANEKTIEEVVRHVSLELRPGMTTEEIYGKAFALLRHFETKPAARYSMKRAVLELGPSGFPFEDFIGEIFKAKGFTVQTGVMVPGACVEHEVDLIAVNDEKYIVGEAKFHNELGIKSDLKVSLYVQARVEDIQERRKQKGERQVDEGWIITNTKFTKSAVMYGSCKGLKLVSWTYPRFGNLHDLIEETRVHPITCLSTLTHHEKVSLLEKGMVLCKAMDDNRRKLEDSGLRGEHLDEVIAESKLVCRAEINK